MSQLVIIREQYEKALARLQEVLQLPFSEVVRDSAIQRFEFTVDLAWKTMKAYLVEVKGITCTSPKDCVRLAHLHGLIEYDDSWLELIDLRNETAHTYHEELAARIYSELPRTVEIFQKLLIKLNN
ncbi:MAG: HI0074 family nucleotidyltransferase substrate-binding subunit [Patescibacteria group bacterium]